MNVEVMVDQVTPIQWQAYASTFKDNSIYQSWAFGEQRAAEMKAALSHIVIKRGDAVIGLAQVRIKKIPILGAGVAYLYRGPLWQYEGATTEDFQQVLHAIHEEYALRRGLEVRVVPHMTTDAIEDLNRDFNKHGFSMDSSIDAYRTLMLDLSPSLEDLRKSLAQKWRNQLNQAGRKNLTVEESTTDEAMASFEKLYDAMWEKKQFDTGVSVESFRKMQQALPDEAKLTVLLAISDGQPVAGHVSSLLGDTCIYLLGTSNDEGRNTRAAYLLQWALLERAKQAGAKWYDLGGIDPDNNPGVFHFKSGLNGRDCSFVGQFNASAKGSSKFLLSLAERVYRLVKPQPRASKKIIV